MVLYDEKNILGRERTSRPSWKRWYSGTCGSARTWRTSWTTWRGWRQGELLFMFYFNIMKVSKAALKLTFFRHTHPNIQYRHTYHLTKTLNFTDETKPDILWSRLPVTLNALRGICLTEFASINRSLKGKPALFQLCFTICTASQRRGRNSVAVTECLKVTL